jgi:L-serine dehydratase
MIQRRELLNNRKNKYSEVFIMALENDVLNAAGTLGLLFGEMTINDYVAVAEKANATLGEVVVVEEMHRTGQSEAEVLQGVKAAFDHNNKALDLGLSSGVSYLLGTVGNDLETMLGKGRRLFNDAFVDDAVRYTLGSQVGNHEIGLEPCAGTGDSCGYTGLARALLKHVPDEKKALRAIALMLKIGTLFRVGKTTTGCNMEGFGAAAAATAAAVAEIEGGTPTQCAQALVLAVSPTVAVPCVPRISVPGLCATHIAGAILIGTLSARLAVFTSMPVTVDADSMIAMAAAVHPVSAQYVVPVTVDYMRPFFKRNNKVECFVAPQVRDGEEQHTNVMRDRVKKEVKKLVLRSNPITKPFGAAVVGGSSQAVGSPTNMGRIAHELMKGDIQKITIELYPELFSRRGTNVPGILMGAVLGATTKDVEAYRTVMDRILQSSIDVEVREVAVPQIQKITLETTDGTFFVEARNRGGGRIHLVDATPSLEAALKEAAKLGIEVVE